MATGSVNAEAMLTVFLYLLEGVVSVFHCVGLMTLYGRKGTDMQAPPSPVFPPSAPPLYLHITEAPPAYLLGYPAGPTFYSSNKKECFVTDI